MPATWSEQAKLLIEQRGVLMRAFDAFRADWAEILRDVHCDFSRRGWICRTVGKPAEFLQLRRESWPDPWGAAHYEVLCNFEFLRRGIADLSLHIEGAIPNQAAVCSRIRDLLRPHADRIHALLSKHAPSLPELPVQDILKGQLPLDRVTPELICEALEAMMETASFVDEAIFLAGTQVVWRSDFLPNSAPISLIWNNTPGGQEVMSHGGRLGSPVLRVDGTRPNCRPDKKERGSFSCLIRKPQSLVNGCEYAGCVVLKSRCGGTLKIWGHKDSVRAFDWTRQVAPAESWQCIAFRSKVPSADTATSDFSDKGVQVHMNVNTADTEFLIDSIEIARETEGGDK